ncbi:MAG TPA: SpoIID/LytB domain-containing protein [Microthrixaceae bacterium]|nr:SpoIID/LytB domain-containing protein [Microthrixaceae bacterium]
MEPAPPPTSIAPDQQTDREDLRVIRPRRRTGHRRIAKRRTAHERNANHAEHASHVTRDRRDLRRSVVRIAALAGALALAIAGWGAAAPVASAGTAFTFSGSGWGHGVGMSQWGARGMAAQGSGAPQILSHYYSGTAVTTTSTGTIRVLLSTTSAVTLTPAGTIGFSGVGATAAPVSVTSSGSNLSLSGGLGGTVGGALSVQSGGVPVRLSSTGYRYTRGTIVLRPTGSGTVQAVLVTSMQEYLYGLGEMPSSWPAAALQAQAIAARTYAQKKVNTTGGGGTYDIVGGMPDQTFLGFEKEGGVMGNLWVAAVDATDGQVVTFGGALIDAVYSASSGGYTENSEYVWVSALGYLRAVPDPADLIGGNPNASWSRTYTGAQLGAWFGLGEVTSVQVLGATSAAGRTDRATIRLIGTGGSRDVVGTSFRATVNANTSSQLMSTKYTVDGAAAPAPAPAPFSPPSGSFLAAKAEGSNIVVGGVATDPDGAPVLQITSTMGREVAVREVRAHSGGWWSAEWRGSKGTRTICVSVYDNPTGALTPLGCRNVTVK